jgi:hypothetical protein
MWNHGGAASALRRPDFARMFDVLSPAPSYVDGVLRNRPARQPDLLSSGSARSPRTTPESGAAARLRGTCGSRTDRRSPGGSLHRRCRDGARARASVRLRLSRSRSPRRRRYARSLSPTLNDAAAWRFTSASHTQNISSCSPSRARSPIGRPRRTSRSRGRGRHARPAM